MLTRILQGTPVWVYVLFCALIVLGITQSRPRVVAPARVALLPAVFLALSLYGVASTFGAAAAALSCWAAGIATAILLNRVWKQPSGVHWDASAGIFRVPGSWVPLGLMMAVFFARYAIAVSLAILPTIAGTSGFAAAAGFAYGLFSGTFLARALHTWAQRATSGTHPVQSTSQ